MNKPKKAARTRKTGAEQTPPPTAKKAAAGKATAGKAAAKPSPTTPQSLWRTTADIWPFVLGAVGCALGAYLATWLGRDYQQPNYLSTAASILLLGAGAAAIATSFGILHLGFNASAGRAWGIGAIAAGLLTVVTFFTGGATLSPGFIFGLILVGLCLPGFGLGLRADEYRRQFPGKTHFLGEWK